MKSMTRLFLLVPALALAACSVDSYCEDQQSYELAGSVPALKGEQGLRVPQSEAALRIPPPPERVVAFGEPVKDEDGDDEVRCLDKPPEMPALPEAKPAEPAPAAAPAAPEATPAEPQPATPPPG